MKFVLKTLPLLATLLLNIVGFAQEAPKVLSTPIIPVAPIVPNLTVSNAKNDTVIIKLPNGKQMMMVAYGTNLVELSSSYDLGSFINQLDATLQKSIEANNTLLREELNYTRNNSEKGYTKDTSIEISISMNSNAERSSKSEVSVASKKKIVTVITSDSHLKTLLDSLQTSGNYDFQVRTSNNGTRYLISNNEVGNKSEKVFDSSFLQVNLKKSSNDSLKKKYKPAPPFKKYFDLELDLGLNNYLEGNGDIPSDNANYSLSPLGSRYVAVRGQYNFSWKIRGRGNRRITLSPGLEVQWYNFMFRNQVVLQKEGAANKFNQGSLVGFPNIEKSKLTASYLNIPVRVELQNLVKGVNIGASVYVGYLLDAYTKVKYTKPDGDETKNRYREGNYNVNSIQYGFKGYVRIQRVEIFYRQNLTQLFKGDPISPELTPIAFGITL
jgi:hypothetical protein